MKMILRIIETNRAIFENNVNLLRSMKGKIKFLSNIFTFSAYAAIICNRHRDYM